jgi:hypothetical protein
MGAVIDEGQQHLLEMTTFSQRRIFIFYTMSMERIVMLMGHVERERERDKRNRWPPEKKIHTRQLYPRFQTPPPQLH